MTAKKLKFQGLATLFLLIFLLANCSCLFSQTNLLTNPGFETGINDWSVWTATLTKTTDSHSGSYAAKVSNRKNTYDALVRDVKTILKSGQEYYLEVWAKIPVTGSGFWATLNLNVDGTNTYQQLLATPSFVANAYCLYSGTFTPKWTGNLNGANIYFETNKVGTAFPDYYVDDAKLLELAADTGTLPLFKGLKDIKSTMMMGGCVTDGSKNYFTSAKAKAQVLSDCEAVTVQCYPAWGRWDEVKKHVYHLDDFSAKVKEMKSKNMEVTAHMLMGWDQYFPDWYRKADFNADTLDAIMKSWLKAIITSNGNDTLVDIWNVVNEAISWNGKGGYWPDNNADFFNACEMQHMGFEPDQSGLTGKMYVNAQHPVYIRKAFEYARALTNKKLELRDASLEFPTDSKYHAFYQLATHLKKVGAPIDVIGFQTHLNLETDYDWEAYSNNIKRYRQLGYEVNIPEVDLGDVAKNWNDEKAELQKTMYYRLVSAAIKGGATELQTWGFIDNASGWRGGESAFPYTNFLEPKPAYFGMKDALTDMSFILSWDMDSLQAGKMPDVSAYNNMGNPNNLSAPTFVTGFKSKALQFNGSNQYLLSNKLSDSIVGNCTFSCFVKTTSNSNGIIANVANDAGFGFKVGVNANGIVYLTASENGFTCNLQVINAINDDKWHFIAVQRDSTAYRLYVDSEIAVDSKSSTGNVYALNKISVGAQCDGLNAFNGLVDEVKLYDYAVEEASFLRNMLPYCPLNPKLSINKKNFVYAFSWTNQSANTDGFIVERKIAGGNWEEIGGTITSSKLSFTDTAKLFSTNYSYRVRAYNKFGKSSPSLSKMLTSPADPNTSVKMFDTNSGGQLATFYPNPAKDELTIETSGKALIKIFNLQGSKVFEYTTMGGSETLCISKLSRGTYILSASVGTSYSNAKLIKY